MKNRTKNIFVHTAAFWAFIAPCAILFTVFFLVPLFLSFSFSFTNYDGWKKMSFVGLKNYATLMYDSAFYTALGKTFIYALFSLPFKVLVPLLIAILVTAKGVRAKTLARTMIYIPVLLSSIVVGITINWMFGQEYGLVNFLISYSGGKPLEWALNPALATFVIGFASNWASTGFYMVIFIGGIANVSPELYEAASIDGSNDRQSFFKITLPLLLPTTFLVTLLSTINLLKEYALVQGVTQGGPGTSTTFIIQYIFSEGFDKSEYGYASAISLVVMMVFILIALVQFKMTKGGDTEYE
jgi:alpha-1,4-digalacturonate transport system permease protein